MAFLHHMVILKMKITVKKVSRSSCGGTILKIEYIYDFTRPKGKHHKALYFWFFNWYLKIGFKDFKPLNADRVMRLLKRSIELYYTSPYASLEFNSKGDLAEWYKNRRYKWGRTIIFHNTLVEVAKRLTQGLT